MTDSEVSDFERELSQSVRGEVLFDDMSRLIYSTDASLYQMKPVGVVLPRDRQDVRRAVRIAAQRNLPILPRGAGTSLAGQTVTSGLVLDFSKYMNKVLEIDRKERWARVQPGIALDNLNAALQTYGLFFAPDVATSSRANIGGMIGNNSSGVRSVRYGKTVDHVLQLSGVLSAGYEFEFPAITMDEFVEKCSTEGSEGDIYRRVRDIINANRREISERFPKVMRRVSGYNLDEMLDDNKFNLSKLLVGSEGTLGIVTEAILNLEPIPKYRPVAVLHFNDLMEAIRAVEKILEYDPSAVEILDHYGLELARKNPAVSKLCDQFIRNDPKAILIVEFSSDSEAETLQALEKMKADSEIAPYYYHCYEAREPSEQDTVWQVRKNALGVMLGIKGDFKPLPFIEDSCIPVHDLADYIHKLQEICTGHGRQMALYAHASVGVIHVRPILNLKQAEDVKIMSKISQQAFELVCHYKGAWSGEHGDGLVRSYKVQEFFGDQLYEAFREIKKTFDPAGLMNPGKIVDPPPMTENLRIHPEYKATFPKTHFRFEEEEGLDRAVELCTGVGQCRKTLVGAMCPSFIATRDEEHSTRGRANALRVAMSGEAGPGGFTSTRLYEALDLCLECKACKSECPSSVDMAKLKSEFLAHYYKDHGVPRNKRLASMARQAAEMSSRFPALSNLLTQNQLFRWLLELTVGIDRRRRLPTCARETLVNWYQTRTTVRSAGVSGKVILFADTFVNFYEPKVGISALDLLEALGFEVTLADVGCCGRPLISAGFLQKAHAQGDVLISKLKNMGDQDTPIIVLEPSCHSTFKDDYLDLVDDRTGAREIAERVYSFEEFLARREVHPRLSELLRNDSPKILFHGHCQQKALNGMDQTLAVLGTIGETTVDEVGPGCCGMAGSFGYEKKHYEISEKIGNRHLLPAVRDADPDTYVIAPGFSCRSQIKHFTGTRAYHPAELLARFLK